MSDVSPVDGVPPSGTHPREREKEGSRCSGKESVTIVTGVSRRIGRGASEGPILWRPITLALRSAVVSMISVPDVRGRRFLTQTEVEVQVD